MHQIDKGFKLAILNTHPVQYFSPLYMRLAQNPLINLTVYYCSAQGSRSYYDPGFGKQYQWDRPLLEGYSSVFLKNLRRKDKVGSFFSLINIDIIKEIYKNNYDAIWLHGYSYFTHFLAFFISKFLKIPVFMRGESHLYLKRPPWKQKLHKTIISKIYKNCDALLAIGARNKEFYISYGVNIKKIFDVPYVVDNDFFISKTEENKNPANVLREKLGLDNQTPIILYASKFIGRKNPHHLLETFDFLQKKNINAVLCFVGSGPYEIKLKTYVENNKIKNVYFFGFKNQTELPLYYALGDIFVLPSSNEPWGLAINEAMCAGLPIIANKEIGAVPDLVKEGVNGFLYSEGDIRALSEYLEKLVKDVNLRETMGKKSLEIIQTWNYESCIQGVIEALKFVKTRQA